LRNIFAQKEIHLLALRGFETAKIVEVAGYPAAASVSFNGASIDMIATDDNIFLTQFVDAVTGTTPTLAGKLQNSADGSSNWLDCNPIIASLPAVTAAPAAGTNMPIVGYQRDLRYVRYVATIGGTTPSFDFAAFVVAQFKKT
jgi:hypothetical protein